MSEEHAMTVMILLVGEQPIPNLLPVLHERPDEVLLVHTDRTREQSERLGKLLETHRCRSESLFVPAFDIAQIRAQLGERLAEKGWRGPETLFNLTGGTKTMAFAAYELAVRLRSDFLYLQTEGERSRIYRYGTAGGAPFLQGDPQIVPGILTIDDYLRAHVGEYEVTGFSKSEGGLFEKAVFDALEDAVDEIQPGTRFNPTVEIDLVVRCGNQVGVAEIKTSKPGKEGIDQLVAATAREYLGIYTKRFLITAREWTQAENLKDLTVARNVALIELPTYLSGGALSDGDRQLLRGQVQRALGYAAV